MLRARNTSARNGPSRVARPTAEPGDGVRIGDIVLDDPTVSRRHAAIQHDGDHYVVTDAESLNGTYLNRHPIDYARMSDGDELWIGRFHLRFHAAR